MPNPSSKRPGLRPAAKVKRYAAQSAIHSDPLPMKSSGKLVLVTAALLVFYAVLLFDPTISAGNSRVVNLQRLSWQQNLTTVGVGLGIIGALLLIFGPKEQASERKYSGNASGQHHRVDDATLALEEQFAEAIQSNDLATVKRLLSNRSISPHGRNRHGKGWLQYATATGIVQAAETLLAHGASPRDRDDLGRSALDEAQAQSNSQFLALFTKSTSPAQGSDAA
jgi:hypothetical protein